MNSTKMCTCENEMKPTPNEHRMETGDEDSYLPKPEDGNQNKGDIRPGGPDATGAVNWNPEEGLTGVRPSANAYSTTMTGEAAWRQHNMNVLNIASEDLHRINMTEYNSRRGLQCISASVDRNQFTSTGKLADTLQNMITWKLEVERSLEAITEEVDLLEQERRRASQSRSVLSLASSICRECLNWRSMRMGHELIRDNVEESLIKEGFMIREIEDLITKTINQIEEQVRRNKQAKAQLEEHWSDKEEAFHLLKKSHEIRTETEAVMFKPNAVRYTENQTTLTSWEAGTKEVVGVTDAVRAQSSDLRAMLHGQILSDSVADLKKQADAVDVALAQHIVETDNSAKAMMRELEVVVKRNAESERLVSDLRNGIRGLDQAAKVAQTRLDNMHKRPRLENCRDKAHYGLVDEVKSLVEQSSAMRELMDDAQASLHNLIRARSILEKEIQDKLKTLYIDKERCQVLRSQYPSANKLAGH